MKTNTFTLTTQGSNMKTFNSYENVEISVKLMREIIQALEVANKFCGSFTSDDCTDAVALPISDALYKAKHFMTLSASNEKE